MKKRYIKLGMILCLWFALLTFPAAAANVTASGNCYASETLEWTLTEDGVLTISGTGVLMGSSDASVIPWSGYVSQITKIVVDPGVTGLGSGAFYNCTAVQSVVLPNTLSVIGEWAFGGCTALTEIEVPAGVTFVESSAFYGCSALQSVSLPDTVESLGEWAFAWCTALEQAKLPSKLPAIGTNTFLTCSALTEITIPETVTEIGEGAFNGCTSLTEIALPDGLCTIGKQAFAECTGLKEIAIPGGVSQLGEAAFKNCTALQSVTLPDQITVMERQVFMNCSALTSSISVPAGVTKIGEAAFYNCELLPACTLPGTVTSIDSWAFYNCDELTEVVLPDGLTSIGASAFKWCNGLERMTIPDSVTTLGDGIFEDCTLLESVVLPENLTTIPNYMFVWCSGLNDLSVPKSVTAVGEYAFYGCSVLELDFLAQLTSIGTGAFGCCYKLTELAIPSAITEIPKGAFYSCVNLERLTFHAGVTEIGDEAFRDCRKLAVMSFPSSLKTIGEFAFYGCASLTNVEIPAQVELIKTYAFAECNHLQNVMFQGKTTGLTSYAFQGNSESMTLWGYADTGAQRYAAAEGIRFVPYGGSDSIFYGTCDDGLTWRVTKDGVLVISGTFPMRHYTYTIRPPWEFLADRITAVVIEDGVPNLSDELFKGYPDGNYSGYPKLTELTIGSTLTDLGSETFVNCPSLERINLSSDNETYLLKDNVLYSADGKTLVLYPIGREDTSFAVPNSVTAIGDDAFRNSKNLKQVVLPEGLLSVGRRSFDSCTGIEGLVLPSTLTETCESSFHVCRVKTDRTVLSSPASSNNLNTHQYINYGRWTDVIRSHMTENEDGSLSRVEYVNGRVIVERYVRNGREIQWESGFELRTNFELPIFGGYYTDGTYHYLVYGASNYNEDNEKEVLRIIQYNQDWSVRVSSVGLCGANTTVPFKGGTLRCTHWNDYLYLRTCHEMYQDEDGINHQANMTLVIDTNGMQIDDGFAGVGMRWGYTSHSFNQFIKAQDGVLASVDHGDAYPRSVVLTKYVEPETSNGAFTSSGGGVRVLPIVGEEGANDTGVAVGDLEITDEAYLVAGSSAPQNADDADWWRGSYNVFLTVTPRDNVSQYATTIQWLTNYPKNEGYVADPPYLVPVAEDRCLLIWSVKGSGTLSYVYVDAAGEILSEIKTFDGYLSDCEPIASDGGALWYVTQNGVPMVYYLKGDTLLVTNTEDGTATIASHEGMKLVAVSYSDRGQMENVLYYELSDGSAVDLASPNDRVRYFLLDGTDFFPLCSSFR